LTLDPCEHPPQNGQGSARFFTRWFELQNDLAPRLMDCDIEQRSARRETLAKETFNNADSGGQLQTPPNVVQHVGGYMARDRSTDDPIVRMQLLLGDALDPQLLAQQTVLHPHSVGDCHARKAAAIVRRTDIAR